VSLTPVVTFPRAALVLLTVISGCTITPVREASGPTNDVSVPPDTLAFEAESSSPDANADAESASQTTPATLTEVEAAAWTIVAGTDDVGVHSAPGNLYTRLGILTADNDVIATGRSAAVGNETWMEIHWANSTAWVPQLPFIPLEQ